MLRSRLRSEDPGPELHKVQVQFQDSVLPESPLEPLRNDDLDSLPEEGAIGPEIEVLCDLLGNRASPAKLITVLTHEVEGGPEGPQIIAAPPRKVLVAFPVDLTRQSKPVDPTMLIEPTIFSRDHRPFESIGDLFE
jgi:hypothetical protein